MFKCGFCLNQTEAGQAMTRVVTATRPREYHDPYGKRVGRGSEIVSEVAACPACAKAQTTKGLLPVE